MTEFVKLIIENNIAKVMMNNPQKRNALGSKIVNAFLEIFKELKNNKKVRVVVLMGEGQHFCAGADIQQMQLSGDASLEENKKEALALAELFYELYHLPQPTVALVQGFALGGALGLIACCDYVIAEEDARFGFSEVKLGVVPAVISPYVVSVMGVKQARRYFLTAEKFTSKVALALGLVDVITSSLEDALEDVLHLFLQNSPQAMAITKELISLVSSHEINLALMEKTVEINAHMRMSPDGREGLKAFLEKREPAWNTIEKIKNEKLRK